MVQGLADSLQYLVKTYIYIYTHTRLYIYTIYHTIIYDHYFLLILSFDIITDFLTLVQYIYIYVCVCVFKSHLPVSCAIFHTCHMASMVTCHQAACTALVEAKVTGICCPTSLSYILAMGMAFWGPQFLQVHHG